MTKHSKLTSSAVVLAVSAAVYGAPGDYSPTSPARPSAGYINDWLRKDDPYKAAWDVGIATRLRYEIRDGFAIAGVPGSLDFRDHGADTYNDYLLLRVRPRVGYTAEWYSFMLEGRHSDAFDDQRSPNPEEDSFDLHQAYITVGNHKEFPLSLKVGRQEMSYGDERLLGAFAWSNIGRVFDAAKVRWQNPWFAADFFTSKLVLPDDDNFNSHNEDEWFSGVYATTKKLPHFATDLYLFSRNANAYSPSQPGSLVPGASARDIYTLGLRLKSTPGDFGPWDFSTELMGQLGHFNDLALPNPVRSLDHQAFAAFAGAGYTWTDLSYTPRVGLEYNYASGDDDPLDDKHETFDNLYPTNHKFYGYMDFVSLQNVHNVRLTSSIKPLPRLTLMAEGHSFWLATTSDNFYAVSGARRGGITATPGTGYGINPNYDSYVGSEVDLVAAYAVSPQTTLELGYGHFFTGKYIDQSLSAPTHGSEDANWVYASLNINF
jgi:hypothetical protein